MRGWITQAFGGADNPYADEPSVAYVYDNRVQNHKRVEVGDILFVRNRHRLEGVGRITRIETGSGEKLFFRCPECGSPRVSTPDGAPSPVIGAWKDIPFRSPARGSGARRHVQGDL